MAGRRKYGQGRFRKRKHVNKYGVSVYISPFHHLMIEISKRRKEDVRNTEW
jgi:hypothetical protein